MSCKDCKFWDEWKAEQNESGRRGLCEWHVTATLPSSIATLSQKTKLMYESDGWNCPAMEPI